MNPEESTTELARNGFLHMYSMSDESINHLTATAPGNQLLSNSQLQSQDMLHHSVSEKSCQESHIHELGQEKQITESATDPDVVIENMARTALKRVMVTNQKVVKIDIMSSKDHQVFGPLASEEQVFIFKSTNSEGFINACSTESIRKLWLLNTTLKEMFSSGKAAKQKPKPGELMIVHLEGYFYRGKFLRSNVRVGPKLDMWLMDFNIQVRCHSKEVLLVSQSMGEKVFNTITTAFKHIQIHGTILPSYNCTSQKLTKGSSGWTISDMKAKTEDEWPSFLISMEPLGMIQYEMPALPLWPPIGSCFKISAVVNPRKVEDGHKYKILSVLDVVKGVSRQLTLRCKEPGCSGELAMWSKHEP